MVKQIRPSSRGMRVCSSSSSWERGPRGLELSRARSEIVRLGDRGVGGDRCSVGRLVVRYSGEDEEIQRDLHS
jgi:hypothetical protein